MNLSKIVIAGHVDHGKSTLIGKILNESNSILTDRYQKIESICRSKAMKFEYAFLLDAFEEEQKQGITIDKLEIPWKCDEENHFIFIDTPGHREFINHMVSGSSNADIAFVLIDAIEGIKEQTKQHIAILNLFGIKNIIFIVNKMDLVEYNENIFQNIKNQLELILTPFHFNHVYFIPISAYEGENIFQHSSRISWFQGLCLIETLKTLTKLNKSKNNLHRLSIQDVYKFDDKRIYAAKVLSGEFKLGDEVYFSSNNSKSKIKSIETWNDKTKKSIFKENEVFAFTTNDAFFLPIGEIASKNQAVPKQKRTIILSSYWFSKTQPQINDYYILKLANQKISVRLKDFKESEKNIFELKLESDHFICFDYFEECQAMGRAILLHQFSIVSAGIISKFRNHAEFENKTNQQSLIIWMTGLSGAGKTTLAKALKQNISNCLLLDGDELRQGINSDLKFSDDDRLTQATRTAHLANLLAKQGMNVIVSLISPTEKSRSIAREINNEHFFIETFINVPIEVCAKRDIKGLYKMAKNGNYENLTGYASPYEPPRSPEIIIDNYQLSIEHNVELILNQIEKLRE